MIIPFRVKLLTETAKAPERANDGDLFDLFADSFDISHFEDQENDGNDATNYLRTLSVSDCDENNMPEEFKTFHVGCWREKDGFQIFPGARILVKTGIAIELPIKNEDDHIWWFGSIPENHSSIEAFAVADIRPRSGLALKHGITVLNTPGTIDNSYRKEIGVILYNTGHEPYTIKKGDKIAQMLIRPLYPSSFEIVKDFDDTGRGGFGSTGN